MKAKKNKRERSAQMQQVSAGLQDVLGMTQWRKEHPKATFREIEEAVDERVNQLRAQLIQDVAQMGETQDWRQKPQEERPECATCGHPLLARGERIRWIQTSGGEAIKLKRTYGTCPQCGQGFFPLDEQLGLRDAGMTPRAEERLVRLASWMPYASAKKLLKDLLGVQVSKATARRMTLEAGAAALAEQEVEQERLKKELPEAPKGAQKQAMSADGAFVPLVGGQWAEVKTLVIGEVTRNTRGESCTQQLSSFSRLADVERFEQAALVETHRRGLEKAGEVCAVQDGAEWLPGVVDYHRKDAVRILDFAHAAEHISAMVNAARSAGSVLADEWLSKQLHDLKHEGPRQVLVELRMLVARHPDVKDLSDHLAYLEKREAQMHYPTFQAAGWPIGSGCVESANKLVVEARLKGAGMHWERDNVNSMLVLRNAVCNDRWDETWQATTRQRQQSRKLQRDADTQVRCEQAVARFFQQLLCCMPPTPRPPLASVPPAVKQPTSPPAPLVPSARRPAANHPWRRAIVTKPKEAVLAKK
jgi:hypothetical protein